MSKDSTLIVCYSLGGQGVNADLTGSVDDTVVAQVYSHMDYSTFVVGEETEVICVCWRDVGDGSSLGGLL